MLCTRLTVAAMIAAISSLPMAALAQQVTPPASSTLTAKKIVIVPAGARVAVSTTDKVSSATAQVGDIITISATEDVVVDGYVVVSKGAGGQAEIASVERAHGNGGSGNLGIKMDWISAIDGEKILLTSTPKTTSEEDRGGGSSTATILSYALLGPLGLFMHNFSHGKDVILDPSKVLSAYTNASVHITSGTLAGSSGFAH